MFGNLQRNGAAVFGIDIDLAGSQRFIDDGRVAQALAHLGLDPGGLCLLRHDLGQHIGFGETLGAHAQGFLLRGPGSRGGQEAQNPDQREAHQVVKT